MITLPTTVKIVNNAATFRSFDAFDDSIVSRLKIDDIPAETIAIKDIIRIRILISKL